MGIMLKTKLRGKTEDNFANHSQVHVHVIHAAGDGWSVDLNEGGNCRTEDGVRHYSAEV